MEGYTAWTYYRYQLCKIYGRVSRSNVVMSRHYNAGRRHSSFERVEEFKYLGTNLTNQNSIQEEIKSRLKSGNVCYHSVQKLLSSSLLSKNEKTKIHRTIILPLVLYGCETWSFTLWEERRLRVFANRVLRKMLMKIQVVWNMHRNWIWEQQVPLLIC